jgi:hypothetical protein
MSAVRRSDGPERSSARHSLAAESILGLSKMWASLLDDVPIPAWRRGRGAPGSAGTRACDR